MVEDEGRRGYQSFLVLLNFAGFFFFFFLQNALFRVVVASIKNLKYLLIFNL